MTGNLEYLFPKSKDIRSTFLDKEDFLSSFTTSCRIHIDYVRLEFRKKDSRRDLFSSVSYCIIAYNDIVRSQNPEVMYGRIAKNILHFVIQYF